MPSSSIGSSVWNANSLVSRRPVMMLRWLSNLRIRWKILIAPAFLALALLSLGLYALHIQKANQAVVDEVTTGVAQQAELANAFETSIWKANTFLYRLSATA